MSRIILIPAAGAGSRFQKAGLSIPKPLIRINGQSLLEHTLDSFELMPLDHLMLAVQGRHEVRLSLEAKLRQLWPDITLHWLELDELLPGQLVTSSVAINALLKDYPEAEDLPLLIHNCDTGFRWDSALGHINSFASMPVFPAEGEHWSFGQPDPANPAQAIAIAEKQRISELASIGLYGFITANAFLEAANNQLATGHTVNGEHYIAPMLQAALREGKQVSLPRVSGVRLYGTPQELMETFGCSWQEVLDQNN